MIKFPLNEPSVSDLEEKYALEVLRSGWLSAGGEHTNKFEELIADYLNIKYAVAVQSGTAALHLALKAAGVANGDKVILPNYSCGASISAVSQCGAKPIVLDIEMETYGLDVKYVKLAIEKFKPKALQLVHVYGFPARDTLEIKALCDQYNVLLIEDSSEALGATLGKKKIGSFGDIATFSIRSEKMIGVGEGGIVVTNDSSLNDKIMKLASRSAPFRTRSSPYWEKYFYDGEGYNYRLPHILGALAHAQIERFPHLLKEKKRVGLSFREIFSKNKNWDLQKINNDSSPVFWLNTILFKNTDKFAIRDLGSHLMKIGIEVRSGFWPLSDMEAFSSEVYGLQSNGHHLYDNLLVLPSAMSLTERDIEYIYQEICKFLKK